MPKELLDCYNRGCGQKFDPDDNKEDSCTFHPGKPFFHDAYKGWSCCNKKCTDFTQFLNIQGCTKSFHNNEKPPEQEKPVLDKLKADEVIVVRPPVQESLERPPIDSAMTELKADIAQSLKQQLENLKKVQVSLSENENSATPSVGTSCKNASCKAVFEGVESFNDQCVYHPGVAIFHEGMKFWSCCVKRTSDFETFLEQAGCSIGNHVWFKKENNQTGVQCRYDWHQTASHVVISVFAKKYDPFRSYVKLNPIRFIIHLYFPENECSFDLDLELTGVVKVTESSTSMMGTKVEVKLRKAEPGAWKSLNVTKTTLKSTTSQISKECSTASLENRVDAVDLSDL